MKTEATTKEEPQHAAKRAGLRYVETEGPGIGRRRRGSGFVYQHSDRRSVRDARTIRRIRAMVLPPAWHDVWICPDPRGHIQAVGLDDRGRRQYRYHQDWREARDRTKFHHMLLLAKVLPRVRRRVRRDMGQPGLPREKVLATVVDVLDRTGIRVGNEEYATTNHAFGLTTLHNRHVVVRGEVLRFEFRGKSGMHQSVGLRDKRAARIVRQCQEIPGHQLFQYLDDEGHRHKVHSEDVNAYLREISSEEITAKDFRTWAGTITAAEALGACEPFPSEADGKKNVVAAVKMAAEHLGNRPATCRAFYVHPAVIDGYMSGELARRMREQNVKAPVKQKGSTAPAAGRGLSNFEKCVVRLLT